MPHYTCTGDCKGISMQPGECMAKECAKHGKPLTECSCTDGKHDELQADENPESEQVNLLDENEEDDEDN